MTGSAFKAMDVELDNGNPGEGFGEGSVQYSTGPEGGRMTGSALQRWTLYLGLLLAKK